MTRLRAALPVLFLGALIAGCSSDDTSESEGPPAVCSSVEALQTSVDELQDVQVTDDGLTAVQDAVASVETDVRQVVDDATSELEPQVDQLQADVDDLRSSVDAALDAPSADTLRAVGSSISTLTDAVTGLAEDVGSTC